MISFYNDYNELAHPEILKDLVKNQATTHVGYGNDEHTLGAIKHLQRAIANDQVDIHLLTGGTMINLIGLKAMLRSYEGVVSCDSGHIIAHENGAIEATGHQVVQADNVDGKMTVEALDKVIRANRKEYNTKLRVVYISNATEFGTVYTKNELEELSAYCRANNLYIYMDGARMGTAITSEKSDLTLKDIAYLVDVFTIGGTKNGMISGEALVISNPIFRPGIRRLIKQRGGLLSKGFSLGMQFETMFKDGLYFKLAEHANKMAKDLAEGMRELGIEVLPQASNLVFPTLSDDLIQALSSDFMFEVMDEVRAGHHMTRFVTRWATTEEDVEKLLADIKNFQKNN